MTERLLPIQADHLAPVEFVTAGSSHLSEMVGLRAAAESLLDIAVALDATASAMTSGEQVVEWLLERAEPGSLVSMIVPVPIAPIAPLIVDETVNRVANAISIAQAGHDPATILPASAGRAVSRLVDRVAIGDLSSATFARGNTTVTVTSSAVITTAQAADVEDPGTIEGVLLGVQFGGNPYLTIRDELFGRLIHCRFSTKDLSSDQIKNALQRRVAMHGDVRYFPDGSIRGMSNTTDIYVFPGVHELPQVDDIIGIDPELTEGLSSEEWVRLMRA